MTVSQYNRRGVGTFSSRQKAKDALNELQRIGFSMDKVSIVAQDADQADKMADANVNEQSLAQARDGDGPGAIAGSVLGAAGGLLVGGPLAIAGGASFLAAGMVATALGAGIGGITGGTIGAYSNLGTGTKTYKTQLSQGRYLMIVDGTEDETRRAESILGNRGIQGWVVYS